MKQKVLKRKKATSQKRRSTAKRLAWALSTGVTLGAYGATASLLQHGLGLSANLACLLAGGAIAYAMPGVCQRLFLGRRQGDWHDLDAKPLKAFTEAARSVSNLGELSNLIVATMRRVACAETMFLWLPPAGEPSFHLMAGFGRLPTAEILPEFSLRQLTRHTLQRAWKQDDAPEAFAMLMSQIDATVSLPLSLQGHLLGLITLGPHRHGRDFRPAELARLTKYAAVFSHAMAPYQLKAEHALHLSKLEAVSRLYKDAEKRAITDGLTGLTTHLHFQEQLAKRFFEARRYGQPLSLMFIDIDHFKQINDTFGHPTGDEVLRRVSEVMQHTARACDTVARYGGEEIAMILPQTDLEGAFVFAERIREAVSALSIPELGGNRHVSVTVSVGVAQLQDRDLTPGDLLDRADRAVYEAKHGGRNRVIQSA